MHAEKAIEEITSSLREIVHHTLRRRGAVVGLSGGIDSTVAAALCAHALGAERVLGLSMPERESADETPGLSLRAAQSLGIDLIVEDITPALEGLGCYRRRDAAVRTVIAEYEPGWKSKIVLPSLLGGERLRTFAVVVESPNGEHVHRRLTAQAYRDILAATNFKQRIRKVVEYHHADRLDYAVVGTPNRLEYDQGFFVKNGDGAADVKPIAHLYKTQVYQLAEALGVPDEIRTRPPTTDTYSLAQDQEEFYFSLSHERLDLCLYALNAGLRPASVTAATGLTVSDVARVFEDIKRKREATRYLHLEAQLVAPLASS